MPGVLEPYSKAKLAGEGEAKKLRLTEYADAFYTAVANNDNGRELMLQEKLRELAVVLTERVKQNTSAARCATNGTNAHSHRNKTDRWQPGP